MKMNQEKKQLYNQFEKEVWLYLDRDLPDDRMTYWREKIDELPELKKFIEDYKIVSKSYDGVSNIDIGADTFNAMIDKAIMKRTLTSRIRTFIKNILNSDTEFAFGKIAFAGVLIIAAIIISVLSDKPSPVSNFTNTINSEILAWDAEFFDNQISKVGTMIRVVQDDEYRKYYRYKLAPKNVDKNLNLINTNIENLKVEIINEEL